MKSSDEFHSSFLLWWPQDWGGRFREKTMRCARSAQAAAALPAAPPRPQAQAHTAATQSSFSISCSISTVLCFDSLQTGRNEAGREVPGAPLHVPAPSATNTRPTKPSAEPTQLVNTTTQPYPSQVQPAPNSSARRHTGPSPPPLQAVPNATKLVTQPYAVAGDSKRVHLEKLGSSHSSASSRTAAAANPGPQCRDTFLPCIFKLQHSEPTSQIIAWPNSLCGCRSSAEAEQAHKSP